MSGIIGVCNLDGAPVERAWLEATTGWLAFRGPDRQDCWSDGAVGLGTAMLRTTFEAEHEQQPCSLDGQTWISADARVDGRAELLRELRAGGQEANPSTPDVELILRAYALWGKKCVEHLIGDFAFILWDGRRCEFFCARDPFGAAPLYYARVGNTLLVSNTLNAIRLHVGVSDRLDEQAVADYLVFSLYQATDMTIFSDIRRLPPAHILTVKDGQIFIQRYWSLPEDVKVVRPKRREETVERFRELFEQAVGDRLRTDHVGCALSGGMDSTSIAATAQRLLQASGKPCELRGATIVFERLIPDREIDYARLVSEHCHFQTEIYIAENYLTREPAETAYYPPEPWIIPGLTAEEDILYHTARYARVYLMGYGGDPLFAMPYPRWQRSLRDGDFRGFLRSLRRQAGILRRRWTGGAGQAPIPEWVEADFAARTGLRQRWVERLRSLDRQDPRQRMASAPLWEAIFRGFDPGFTGVTVKNNWPFFDLRLVTFMLSVPPDPWCSSKYLLRQAMREILPEAIVERPKTILQGQPRYALLQESGIPAWMIDLAGSVELAPYIDQGALKGLLAAPARLTPLTYKALLPVFTLADWLRRAPKPGLAQWVKL